MFRSTRILTAALLVASTTPAVAADTASGATRLGGFVGARLQLKLGSSTPAPARFGLVATTAQLQTGEGRSPRLTLSEGLEFGLNPRGAPAFSIGGVPATSPRFGATEDGRNGWLIAGGVAAAAGLAYVLFSGGGGCVSGETRVDGQCVVVEPPLP